MIGFIIHVRIKWRRDMLCWKQQLVKMMQATKWMFTLLEQAKHPRIFALAMFIGFLSHTIAPRRVVFLTQDQYMFFKFGQSLCQSSILGLTLPTWYSFSPIPSLLQGRQFGLNLCSHLPCVKPGEMLQISLNRYQ